jgi:hypothetical protein
MRECTAQGGKAMSLRRDAVERLEDQLLLSRGGGLCYDEARVEADPDVGNLVIGLGGTGADILIRIKNEVTRHMILPQNDGKVTSDTPNNVSFLAIDSDESTQYKTWGTASFDFFGSEFCCISVANLPAVIDRHIDDAKQDNPVWNWYDGITPILVRTGAGGYRQTGRLMLFENIRIVYDTIMKKVNTLISSGASKINVFILAGVAGGTGSGTFLDIAYLVREYIKSQGIANHSLLGYIVLPDVNLLKGGHENRLWTNGFACLKELDYWMNVGEPGCDYEYRQNYGNGIIVNGRNAKVVDFCHLISAQNSIGENLTYNNVIQNVAESIIPYITKENGLIGANSTISSMYDNIARFMNHANANKGAFSGNRRYLSVGMNKLEVPYDEIVTLLGARLFQELQETLSMVPTRETFQADMRELDLIPEPVVHNSLQDGIPPSPLDGMPEYQYQQIWGRGNNAPKNNRPFEDIAIWMRQYRAGIARNAANYAQTKNGTFREFVDNKMLQADRGPVYLALLLYSQGNDSIIPTLTKMIERCHDEEIRCLNDRERMERELLVAYNAENGKLFNRHKSIDLYLNALNNWAKNENDCEAYKARAKALHELRDYYLQKMYDNVFTRLADVLQSLRSIFQQNFIYIQIQQQNATHMGIIGDNRYVWPLIFEYDNEEAFQKILTNCRVEFFRNLRDNLKRCIGVDLNRMKDIDGRSFIGIPGFLSEFISQEFRDLLPTNMDSLRHSWMSNRASLHQHLDHLMSQKTNPMIPVPGGYEKNDFLHEFILLSVPGNSPQILSEVNQSLSDPNVTVKISQENTRISFVKILAGISLQDYFYLEKAERIYEDSMSNEITRKGVHLRPEWKDEISSPRTMNANSTDVSLDTATDAKIDTNGENEIEVETEGENTENIDITEKFTDMEFRNIVKQELSCTDDMPITSYDAAKITKLTLNTSKIHSLDGFEYLSGLEEFNIFMTDLESLPPLPKKLKILDCYQNALTSLPKLPRYLNHLECSNNQLTSLPSLPSTLAYLSCASNKLTELPDLPYQLIRLECSSNRIIKLQKLPPHLSYLNCSKNKLTYLPHLPDSLYELWCLDNNIKHIPNIPKELKTLQPQLLMTNTFKMASRGGLEPIRQSKSVQTREGIIKISSDRRLLQIGQRDVVLGKIQWQVLDIKEGKALLLSEKVLELAQYHHDLVEISWEQCDLRAYLNGAFLQRFSVEEQTLIVETMNTDNYNQWFGKNHGNVTNDKIFLLNIAEVVKYFGDSGQLRSHLPMFYIQDQYSSARKATFENEESCWWLRSPGYHPEYAAVVDRDGDLIMHGHYVNYGKEGGVRPALWIKC